MKRIFPILLTVLLLMSLLGCADKEAPSSPAATPTAAPTSTPQPTEEPTPTPEPTPAPLSFTLDPYKAVPNGSEEAGLWKTLADAFLAEAPVVEFEDRSTAASAYELLCTSPYGSYAVPTLKGSSIELAYNSSKSLDTLSTAVCTRVNALLNEGHNDLETLLLLYRAFSTGYSYSENESFTLYDVLVDGSGDAEDAAFAFQFLLRQFGFSAGTAFDDEGGFDHYWVVAEYDGKLYHFDPVMENSATAGEGLLCFGMSDKAHHATGCSDEDYTVLHGILRTGNEPLCTDTRFDDVFSGVRHWQLESTEHRLSLSYVNSETYPVVLDTENCTVTE